MFYYEVAPNRIVRSGNDTFTYHSEIKQAIGTIVHIPIGSTQAIGVIISNATKPDYPTKEITASIEAVPLPLPLIQLATWMSAYYATPLATVLQTLLPRGIQKNRRHKSLSQRGTIRNRTKFLFTKQQQAALNEITAIPTGSILLHGVTGSGKTAIYIELTKRTLAAGRSVIILVPEISLTSQLVDELGQYFDNIALTHSRHTEAERHQLWRELLLDKHPRVVVGPRSALFMPLASVGLIVIDEAHEPSFKQEQSPRYSALRAASILARHHTAKVVMGSATPLIADYFVATHTKQPIVTLTERARNDRVQPSVELVDMTKRINFKHHRFLSDTLIDRLRETLLSGNQGLIFHNRRGSASTTLCESCGWMAACPRCFLPFSLHADHHHLRCHVCGITETVPTNCPVCGSTGILHKGIGTKLIESELKKLFPNKKIMRFDGDSLSTETIEHQYPALYEGEIDIMIGTQVLAKGLDLPKLRFVGVIQADAGLSLPDYSASERTFQLLAQVVGRVGRSHHPTTVVVQSYQPQHQAVVNGLAQNYSHFYDLTLTERRRSYFPPFCYLLKLTCIYKTEAAAIKNSQALSRVLRHTFASSIEILGPTPAFYERQRDTFRWQLVIKSPRRAVLVDVLTRVPTTHWQSELDPISLL